MNSENCQLFVEVKGDSRWFDGREWVHEFRDELRTLNDIQFSNQAKCGMAGSDKLILALAKASRVSLGPAHARAFSVTTVLKRLTNRRRFGFACQQLSWHPQEWKNHQKALQGVCCPPCEVSRTLQRTVRRWNTRFTANTVVYSEKHIDGRINAQVLSDSN